MSSTRPRFALVLLVFAFTLVRPSLAQETPPAADGPESLMRLKDVHRGALLFKTGIAGAFLPAPVLSTDVSIRVTGIVARARVSQRFRNGTDGCVEGIYVFPLPDGAAVDQLRMVIGDRVIEGAIQERAEAQKTYEQAKSEGRKAALLEQERPNMFTASVASIGAGEEIGVEIEYQETLRFDQGSFSIRFPMVVGPRYIPGSPADATVLASASGASAGGRQPGSGWGISTDSVPDADRITPAVLHPRNGPVNPVHLRVDLDPGFPLRRVASVTHGVVTKPAGTTRATVTLADESAYADRDFELAWEPDLGHEPKAAVFMDRRGGETYALVMVIPPEPEVRPGARLPRETVFVIDTSGSMEGTSIEGARRALIMALGRLAPEDRFNVIEFNSVTRALYPDSRRALPEAVEEAKGWVSKLRAQGGTEMMPALAAALRSSGEDSGNAMVRQVLFMTDGAVGNEEQLFRYIQDHLGRSRLFTVGLGSAPNSHFMTKAAEFGRGTFTFVASAAEVDLKMSTLFRKLEAPVLTNLEMVWDDASAEVWPPRVPDLYSGEPIVVVARLASGDLKASGGVTIRGQRLDLSWSRRLSLSDSSPDSGLDRLWARRKIASLMDTMSGTAEREPLKKQVVELALSHHLVSSFTSLVAVDVSPTVARGVVCEARPVPVNLPAGWSHEHVFGSMPSTATPGRLYILIGLALAMVAAAVQLQRRTDS